jgi:hypothetical protein
MEYSSQWDAMIDSLFIIGGKAESDREFLRQNTRHYILSNKQHSSNIIRLHLEATLYAFLAYSLSENKTISLQQQNLEITIIILIKL